MINIKLFEIFATLGLDSKEFDKGITTATSSSSKIVSKISEVISKSENLSSAFQNTSSNTETLANKQKMLESILEKNKFKVNDLAQAFNKSAKEKGVDSKETQELANKLNKAENELKKTESSLKNVTNETQKMGKSMDDTKEKTGGLTSGIGNLIKTVGGIQLVSKAFDMITSSIGGAVERYDILNRFPKVLGQMGFEAEESENAVKKLTDRIIGLPTALPDIVSVTQKIALLTGDLEGATDTTLALNDAFLASGSTSADASRGIIQYTQMLSRGKPDIVSWRTLQETMGYALREVAVDMLGVGKTSNDLYEALKEGDITFDQFNAKMIELDNRTGGFAETAKTASSGINTSWTNLRTAVVRSLTDIITKVDDGLEAFGGIEGVINNVKNGFTAFLSVVGNVIENGLKLLTPAILFLSENMDKVLGILIPLTSAFVAYKTVMMISGIISAVTTALNGMTIAQYALNLAMSLNPIGAVIAVITALVAGIIYLWNTNEGLRNAIIGAWEAIKGAGEAVWGWLVKFFTEDIPNAIASIPDVINNIVIWFQELPRKNRLCYWICNRRINQMGSKFN